MPRLVPLIAGVALLASAAGCDAGRTVPGRATGCTDCHGSDGNPAPPVSPRGGTATTDPGVGAHRLHLRDTAIRQALTCTECHVVPDRLDAPGHLTPPTLTWGPLASAKSSQPAYDAATLTCSGVYCHGGNPTLHGGARTSPIWTYAVEPDFSAPPQQSCTGCHGWPPPPPHAQLTSCQLCHAGTVRGDGTIDVAGGLHVDGVLEQGGSGGVGCASCHGYPPPNGAHLAHFGWTAGAAQGSYGDTRTLEGYVDAGLLPASFPSYAFGCGNCHPTDPARHMDGTIDVELAGTTAPAGSLKSLNPAEAAYAGGSCGSVYCHSSGQVRDATAATPAYVASPDWSSPVKLGCGGCHANPPRYASGGSGAVTANSHLGLASDGWTFGHFGGLPGVWHTSKHGQGDWAAPNDAAPITCQACHDDTVDPSNTGPSGFYYLDTSGDYSLAGAALQYDCLACHAPGSPTAPTGIGRALPLRHVNGSRDVVFDPRQALPALAWLPSAPFTPTRPIWVTNAALSGLVLPPGAVYEPATIPPPPAGQAWPYQYSTLSLHLGSAGWAPATKTCSSVACHLSETSVVWGGASDYDACARCHGF